MTPTYHNQPPHHNRNGLVYPLLLSFHGTRPSNHLPILHPPIPLSLPTLISPTSGINRANLPVSMIPTGYPSQDDPARTRKRSSKSHRLLIFLMSFCDKGTIGT